MALPSLVALSRTQEDESSGVIKMAQLCLHPKALEQLTPDAPNGRYCLDSEATCDASVVLLRTTVDISAELTEELRLFMRDETKVPKTPNPMNRSTYLKRRQCTFGAKYNFGQKVESVPFDDSSACRVVTTTLAFAKEFATSRGIAAELYNGVHVNYYPDGSAGLAAHSDSEADMLKGLPIISVTLLAGDPKPRPFSIYTKPKRGETLQKVADVNLGHGDVIVMMGSMQQYFLHGVEPAKPPKAFKNAERINLTVRAFTPDAVAHVGEKRPRDVDRT